MMKIHTDYPSLTSELKILGAKKEVKTLESILNFSSIKEIRDEVENIFYIGGFKEEYR